MVGLPVHLPAPNTYTPCWPKCPKCPLHPCWPQCPLTPPASCCPSEPHHSASPLMSPTHLLAPNTLTPNPLLVLSPYTPDVPYTPAGPQHPYPRNRDLVVRSGTTTGEHDMSSACGSGSCFVRCTPTPSYPLNVPRERHLVAKSGIN